MKTGGPGGSRALLRIPARDSRLYGTCRPIGGDDGTCIRPVALRTQLAPVEHAPPIRNWWRPAGLARAFALGPLGSAFGGPVALLRSRTRDLVIAGHPLFLSELRPRGKWTRWPCPSTGSGPFAALQRQACSRHQQTVAAGHEQAERSEARRMAARARRVKPQLRSLGAGRFLRTSALIDCG